MKKTYIIIVITLLIAGFLANRGYSNFQEQQLEEQKLQVLNQAKSVQNAYLEVPFICQAPLETTENWELHEESCEEAAVLQAHNYINKTQLTKQQANEIILDMIAWQEAYFGSHKDLYAEEIKEFIHGYYQIPLEKITIIQNASLEDIHTQIALGNPVIAGVTGEILKNPYYPYPGYHALTIIGFTETQIITNDNGTRRGANFNYDNDIFMNALKDAEGSIIIINQ